jgi:superfamily I DNA and/or RNA helicase
MNNTSLNILKSWHLVEFFQPYNIPDNNESQIKVSANELSILKETVLPWLDTNAYQKLKVNPNKSANYQLYLNVFDKAEVEKISTQCFGEEVDTTKNIEFVERLQKEGDTCFAKLTLDQWGTPNFDEMSVSTLPWALGHLQRNTLEKLNLSGFDVRNELLKEALDRISAQLPAHPDNSKIKTLNANAIITLIDELNKWAQFTPESQFVFCLYWYETSGGGNSSKEKEVAVVDDEGDEDESQPDERVMPILNSFYIDDIEKVINSISAGKCNKALLDYLTIRKNKEADLYTSEGLDLIIKKMAPDLLPMGRWPESPKYNMTLMQQFAINTTFSELKHEGLISVNGPPGTGKTTLLRDIIAQNIVERATKISALNTAKDGLTSEGYLIDELTGFEMVVASSNNAAVENISKELPLVTSLGEEFADLDHYKPIANQLNATKTKKGLQPLSGEEQCWGLISAVLGRKDNREKLKDDLFFTKHFKANSKEETERPEEYNFLNLWRWNKLHGTLTFKEAKEAFLSKKKLFDKEIASLKELEHWHHWFQLNSKESFLSKLNQDLAIAESRLQGLTIKSVDLSKQIKLIEQRLFLDKQNHEKLKGLRPSFFSRLFRRKNYRQYESSLNESLIKIAEVKNLLGERNKLKRQNARNISSAETQVQGANEKLVEAHTTYKNNKFLYYALKDKHKGKALPDSSIDIGEHDLQRNAYWQDKGLNHLRSELFIAALKLQQAWLGEALKQKRFTENVFKLSSLLDGKDDIPVKQLWQILFLFVPVISTTFASLGRMFKSLSSAELGWLMIDEAGQSVPQAAVGGIWRAKRVVVVGDPLQIEPVFTTPPDLVEALCKLRLGDEQSLWNPQLCSVQQISDRANKYGCELNVMNENVWVGIPLWVHRRCIEPMFSIANQIAYDGRMIHGLLSDKIIAKKHSALGDNYWLVSKGTCSKKQYKKELGEDTLRLLLKIAEVNGTLNDVYVITPFKMIKQELSEYLDNHLVEICEYTKLSKKEYFKWRSNHIGTIHTFQGKENQTVILVLGCDPKNNGGAVWAASKPNLLNVAITRAKENIFVIGDPEAWQTKNYFSLLAKVLPQKQSQSDNENGYIRCFPKDEKFHAGVENEFKKKIEETT